MNSWVRSRPGDALDGPPSGLDDGAVREHDLEAEHVVAGHAVLDAAQPAGVRGDVAADRAERLARRVGRVPQADVRGRVRDVGVDDPRFEDGHLVDGIDLEDPVHPFEAQDQAPVDRGRAAAQRAARAARDDRDAVGGGDAHGGGDLLGGRREGRHLGLARHDPLGPVEPVGLEHVRVGDERAVGQRVAELLDERPRHRHASRVDPGAPELRGAPPARSVRRVHPHARGTTPRRSPFGSVRVSDR